MGGMSESFVCFSWLDRFFRCNFPFPATTVSESLLSETLVPIGGTLWRNAIAVGKWFPTLSFTCTGLVQTSGSMFPDRRRPSTVMSIVSFGNRLGRQNVPSRRCGDDGIYTASRMNVRKELSVALKVQETNPQPSSLLIEIACETMLVGGRRMHSIVGCQGVPVKYCFLGLCMYRRLLWVDAVLSPRCLITLLQ